MSAPVRGAERMPVGLLDRHLADRGSRRRARSAAGAAAARRGTTRSARARASGVAEADVGQDPVEPARERPGAVAETRSRVGIRTSRTSIASSRTATPRMTPISFGGSGPERAKVKKTATMTAAAAKITRPEWARPPTAASRGSPVLVLVLLGRGEQEDGVVHRDREDHREEEDRPPGVQEALRLEAEQAGAVAVLEDQPGDRRRRRRSASRLVRTPSAAISGACRATSRSRKPSASTTPITSGVFARERAARGRGSRRRRRRRARRRAAPRGAGRSCGRRPRSRGRRSGSPGSSASPPRPGCGGVTRAMPGSCVRRRPTAAASPRGRDDLERAGGAGAEGLLHLRVADARGVAGRDDLDRRHAGLQARRSGSASRTSSSVAAGP